MLLIGQEAVARCSSSIGRRFMLRVLLQCHGHRRNLTPRSRRGVSNHSRQRRRRDREPSPLNHVA